MKTEKTKTERELIVALSRMIDAATSVYDGRSDDFPELVKATEEAYRVYSKAKKEGKK